MRVALTGASGFIGKHLRKHFPNLLILDRNPKPFKADALIHLGWKGVFGKTHNSEDQFSNITIAARLLQNADIKTFISIGSQAEYGPQNRILSENAPLHPVTPYGIAKVLTSKLTEAHCQNHNIRFVWFRLFSCYGPGDNPNWLIPSIIHSLLQKKSPALTHGKQLWDTLYIDDVISAIKLALTSNISGIFNLASGNPLPIADIAKTIQTLINPTIPLGFGKLIPRPDQPTHLQADITKIQSLLASSNDRLRASEKSPCHGNCATRAPA